MKYSCYYFANRKDTQGFFAFPVNDTIAPGYSNIITHPMDFSFMKYKIDSNDYHSLEQFRVITLKNISLCLMLVWAAFIAVAIIKISKLLAL